MIDEAIYELTKIKLKNYEKDKNEIICIKKTDLINLIIKVLKFLKKY